MRLTQHLNERSFRPSDVPQYFRAVIDIDTKDEMRSSINNLKNMKLKGVRGISDTGEIAYDFLGVGRNAMLLMKGKDTTKLNKLSRFMYDNPHYFFSEDMAMLKRMYSKNIKDNRGTWHNVADKVFQEMVERGIISKYEISANAPGQEISYTDTAKNTTVNSIRDAIKTFKKAMKEVVDKKRRFGNPYRYFAELLELPNKTLSDIFLAATKSIGEIYKSEGEWIVKDADLKIPKGSYLYVLTTYDELIDRYEKGELDGYEKMRYESDIKEEITFKNDLEKSLKGKYKIKYLSRKKWDDARTKHFTKKYNNS